MASEQGVAGFGKNIFRGRSFLQCELRRRRRQVFIQLVTVSPRRTHRVAVSLRRSPAFCCQVCYNLAPRLPPGNDRGIPVISYWGRYVKSEFLSRASRLALAMSATSLGFCHVRHLQ